MALSASDDATQGAGMTDSAKRAYYDDLGVRLDAARADGLFKRERVIVSPQGTEVTCDDGVTRLNLCANNYLGYAGASDTAEAAVEVIRRYGYGLSSVRFICGTQSVHKALEREIAQFLGMEDAILYGSAFDANGGLFEPLFDRDDVIISDELNHASIIDGIRLCRAKTLRYRHDDMADLERCLVEASAARHRIVASDGVFSMDGTIARLDRICDLAERHGALTMIDECHATGVLGATGRGTHEHCGVMGRIDIITGTFGKALGGAMGGFTAGRAPLVETLRQRSRPYLFSNSLAPVIAGTTLALLDVVKTSGAARERLAENARFLREGLTRLGYTVLPGSHPILPVIVHEAERAQRLAARLYELGVLVSGFFFPVVPHGKARVRVQLSAAHTRAELDRALEAFATAGRELGIGVTAERPQ
jgi:glycine C-acetyltransferase